MADFRSVITFIIFDEPSWIRHSIFDVLFRMLEIFIWNVCRVKTQEYDDLKLVYDMTKQAGKVHRELVDVMASEKKLREEIQDFKLKITFAESKITDLEANSSTSSLELETCRTTIRDLEHKLKAVEKEREKEKHERQRGAAEDEGARRIRFLEEALLSAKKAIQANKADEEAMMNEMDITGQALEDLQNQNKQLIDQLREKDNTNLKWMTDVGFPSSFVLKSMTFVRFFTRNT